MDLWTLINMVSAGLGDRTLLYGNDISLTGTELRDRSARGSRLVAEHDAHVVVYLGGNGPGFPVALFAAVASGVPFLPLNFRLSDAQLSEILNRQEQALVVTGDPERVAHLAPALPTLTIDALMRTTALGAVPDVVPPDPDSIAILLMTSGTSAAPKSAVLRHTHLTSYILSSIEFAATDADAATIVTVPPYHIAAVANLLSNLYTGRRIHYLDRFTASEWLDIVEHQRITHAMVVPTMLTRIVETLKETKRLAPETLHSLSYGGSRVSPRVVADALRLFPSTGFVNAYGLTETSSSIAVLGPEEHREAANSNDPVVQARLGSVGVPLPAVTIEIHDDWGQPCEVNEVGNIMVRGPQVAGEYVEAGSTLDAGGWFATRDRGFVDRDGYLFVQGRADDTIIRGGENIAPAEIEDVLTRHPEVVECAVAGVPDEEWGHRIGAFVVRSSSSALTEDELRDFARIHLRSSKAPDVIRFRDELPTTPTGKVLRRVLVDDLGTVIDPI